MLFVICWSGTIAVFSREIDMALDPMLEIAPAAERVNWAAVHDRIAAERPGWWVSQIVAHQGPGTIVEAWVEDETGNLHRIESDPASGAIIGVRSLFGVQRFFRSFHMALFVEAWPVFGMPLGDLIVALFSLPLLALLVTSLIFYRRFWRGFTKLDRRKGVRVFWSDAHKLMGLWSLWFVAAMGVTGVWYLLERSLPAAPPPPVAAPAKSKRLLPVAELAQRAQAAFPELRINAIILGEYERGLFEVHGQDGAWLVRDRAAEAWLDSRTGAVLGIQRSSDLSAYRRWIETADPLHFGNFGGVWSKAVWFVFGLALSGLCLTGAFLHVKRQQRRSETRWRGPILGAYAFTAAALLLSAWFGYEEIRSYGANGRMPDVPIAVTSFIAAWTAATLAILTAWIRAVR